MASKTTSKKTTTATTTNPWQKYMDAAIKDIQKKYGFNYTPEFAKRQAALERQSKEMALQSQRQAVDRDIQLADRTLDRNYFQQYLNTAQSMSNRGINAGLESDQYTKLMMARNAEMAEMLRKAQEQKREIDQQLAALPQEEQVRADQLRNQYMQQLFENALQLQRTGLEWEQFNLQKKQIDEELKLGWARLQEEKRQFNSELEWRKYMYKHMSAAERAQLEWAKKQFGEELAWRRYELQRAHQLTREGWAFTGGLYQGLLGN